MDAFIPDDNDDDIGNLWLSSSPNMGEETYSK